MYIDVEMVQYLYTCLLPFPEKIENLNIKKSMDTLKTLFRNEGLRMENLNFLAQEQ